MAPGLQGACLPRPMRRSQGGFARDVGRVPSPGGGQDHNENCWSFGARDLPLARPLRGLRFFQSLTIVHSHTRPAARLRSSLAPLRLFRPALLLSSLTWGQDGTEPHAAVAPVVRVAEAAARRLAVQRAVGPLAAPKHTVR